MVDTKWAAHGSPHDPSCLLSELGVRRRVVEAHWPQVGFSEYLWYSEGGGS